MLKNRKILALILLISFFTSGCSKVGEAVGINIPEDNIIDENINKSIYYPFRDQMCEWGFRDSGCEEILTDTNSTDTSPDNTNNGSDTNTSTTCDNGAYLVDGECIENDDSITDIMSKWYDILTPDQQEIVKNDKNNIFDDTSYTVLTLLDQIENGILKMLQGTKVVLPYFISNENVDNQLAITTSTDKTNVLSKIVDSSTGAYKVVDSDSILFLELTALGEVGDNEEISLKIQEEDATRYDKEDFNVTIVENNHTYNPVNLYFTYNTIIIEEDDSRKIYFGISYTIDSNVTVVVRSDIEKILSDDNTTLDLSNINEDNRILSTYVENDDQVPFYFRLTAKGKAGDTMELYLVAKDSKGNYDFKKFNVLIVEVGQGDYENNLDENTSDTTSNYESLTGDDFELLSSAQQSLVNNDNNNYDVGSTTKPIITVFNPSESSDGILKIPQGSSINTSFYVKDFDQGEIYTAVYDDPSRVNATIENYGKFTVTYSNKLFFLKLEALGEVGEIVPITIYSQNRNDNTQYDMQSFKVEIVGADEEGSYIEPLLYIGFNRLFIEEGGVRDGLTFSVSYSSPIDLTITIEDEAIAKFDGWVTEDPPKFKIKATGTSGQTTKAIITATDGITTDQKVIDIYIIPSGTLDQYIADEGGSANDFNGTVCTIDQTLVNGVCVDNTTNVDDNTTTVTCEADQTLVNGICVDNTTNVDDNTTTVTCGTGLHLENGVCVIDTTEITCQTGYTLVNEECINTDTNETSDPVCNDGYHLSNGTCLIDVVEPICDDGFTLENGICVSTVEDNTTPNCTTGFHLEDGECVTDVVDATCDSGYILKDGECVKEDTGESIPPLCQDGYNLVDGVCEISLVCDDGFHIENSECVEDLPTCEDGFHLEGITCVADEVVCDDGFHLVGTTCVEDATSCEDGFHVEDGICVSDRDLDVIPYDEWTDTEKNAKSVEICYLKMDEYGFSTLSATAVTAEGFINERESIILHTNKTPIVNGVTQNVTITMIYKEVYTATPDDPILDATYTLPRFRVDYSELYANQTFYVIDEGAGKCYINIFPSADAIPFGVLELVTPDDI
jgi:hypothetical protein